MARHTRRGTLKHGAKAAPARVRRLPAWTWAIAALLVVAGMYGIPRLRKRVDPSVPILSFANSVDAQRQGLAAADRGDYVEAVGILERGARQFPNDAGVTTVLGVMVNNTSYQVVRLRGRLVPLIATSLERVRTAHVALAAFDRASAADPRLPEPHYFRGSVYAAWGLPDDALRSFHEAGVRGDTTEGRQKTSDMILLLQRGQYDYPRSSGFARRGATP